MLENITCLGHSSIKIINNDQIIYIDPYKINNYYADADIIFITHNHYDHYSKEDIIKIKQDSTKIIITKDLLQETLDLGFIESNIITVEPNKTYKIKNLMFQTIPAYNVNKIFHPKENNWVGYIIEINKIKYYIAGDTDITEENQKVICDIAFLPIGGTYTMTKEEAATLANHIKPKVVVPIHYGIIVGTKQDAIEFKNLLNSSIKCEIMY